MSPNGIFQETKAYLKKFDKAIRVIIMGCCQEASFKRRNSQKVFL